MTNKDLEKLSKKYKEFQTKHDGKKIRTSIILDEDLGTLADSTISKLARSGAKEAVREHHTGIGLPIDVDAPGRGAVDASKQLIKQALKSSKTATKRKQILSKALGTQDLKTFLSNVIELSRG